MGSDLGGDNQASWDKAEMEKHASWWYNMLEKTIQDSCVDSDALVRTATCDCLSSIPKDIYEYMDRQHQTLAVALLLPLPTDPDSNVRAAACRALGLFVLFPSLHDDEHFVADMASAVLEQMNDKVLLVRVRASWAQGNLCDVLAIESRKPGFQLRDWISMPVWEKIVITATSAATDNEKLRSNAVRAIGSLLLITPKEYFQTKRSIQLIQNAMAGLTKNIDTGSLKTRWNACHAASNLLKNPEFPIGDPYPWTGTLYNALIQSLLHCRNFKVRINACLALCAPTERRKYGDRFCAVAQAIAEALDSCHQEDDSFQEYRYREQLKEQVRLALEHIRSLSLPSS
ncbi:armadillo-type protein [Dichotomocladium elegans]|nr:armadillo-type protein [Dichotomocladium elegans]